MLDVRGNRKVFSDGLLAERVVSARRGVFASGGSRVVLLGRSAHKAFQLCSSVIAAVAFNGSASSLGFLGPDDDSSVEAKFINGLTGTGSRNELGEENLLMEMLKTRMQSDEKFLQPSSVVNPSLNLIAFEDVLKLAQKVMPSGKKGKRVNRFETMMFAMRLSPVLETYRHLVQNLDYKEFVVGDIVGDKILLRWAILVDPNAKPVKKARKHRKHSSKHHHHHHRHGKKRRASVGSAIESKKKSGPTPPEKYMVLRVGPMVEVPRSALQIVNGKPVLDEGIKPSYTFTEEERRAVLERQQRAEMNSMLFGGGGGLNSMFSMMMKRQLMGSNPVQEFYRAVLSNQHLMGDHAEQMFMMKLLEKSMGKSGDVPMDLILPKLNAPTLRVALDDKALEAFKDSRPTAPPSWSAEFKEPVIRNGLIGMTARIASMNKNCNVLLSYASPADLPPGFAEDCVAP